MSDEEINAIEILQEFKKTGYLTLQYKYNKDRLGCRVMLENTIEIILNLIEKQQKELEIERIDNKYNQEERDEETIPRYKIREKIEEIEEKSGHYLERAYAIISLQELLKGE